MPFLTLLLSLLAVVALGAPASAQYRVGMSAAITGPASSTYAPTYEADKVYFKRVNDAGGDNGPKGRIADDGGRGEPQRGAGHAEEPADAPIPPGHRAHTATA